MFLINYCVPLFKYYVPLFNHCVPLFKHCVPLFNHCVPLFKYCVPLFNHCVPLFKHHALLNLSTAILTSLTTLVATAIASLRQLGAMRATLAVRETTTLRTAHTWCPTGQPPTHGLSVRSHTRDPVFSFVERLSFVRRLFCFE